MQVKIGSFVGNWKVISDRYKKGNVWYNDCECICGTTRPVRNWWLNNSNSKSCGCANVKGRFKSKAVGDLSASYLTSFKSGRKHKGVQFNDDVDLNFLWDLFLKQDKKCAISGVPILLNRQWSKQNKGLKTKIMQTASIDRIDNSLGYTKNNVQWVHKDINFMRGGMTVDMFIAFCKEVYLNNKNNNTLLSLNSKRFYFGSTGNK